jgi:hypothetical protein
MKRYFMHESTSNVHEKCMWNEIISHTLIQALEGRSSVSFGLTTLEINVYQFVSNSKWWMWPLRVQDELIFWTFVTTDHRYVYIHIYHNWPYKYDNWPFNTVYYGIITRITNLVAKISFTNVVEIVGLFLPLLSWLGYSLIWPRTIEWPRHETAGQKNPLFRPCCEIYKKSH